MYNVEERRPGYFAPDFIKLELYRLLSFAPSMNACKAWFRDAPRCAFSELSQDGEQDFVRSLFTTATWLRAQHDRLSEDRTVDECDEWNCGWLAETPGSLPVPLSIREACNKIIHARHWTYELVEPRRGYNDFTVADTVWLTGLKRGLRWECSIHIPDYAAHGFWLADLA